MLKMDKRNKILGLNLDKSTVIASDAELRGDLRFIGAVRVDGRVVGNLDTDEGVVSISAEGYVEGVIKAPSVIVNGVLVGDVHAFEHLQLGAEARIDGDLYYRFMEMVSGAQINGQLHYLGEDSANTVSSVPTAAEFKSS